MKACRHTERKARGLKVCRTVRQRAPNYTKRDTKPKCLQDSKVERAPNYTKRDKRPKGLQDSETESTELHTERQEAQSSAGQRK